jgi:hypothetical protein
VSGRAIRRAVHRSATPTEQAGKAAGLNHEGATTVQILITTDYPVPGDDNAAAAMP